MILRGLRTLLSIVITPVQKTCITVYTVLLQLNRLEFRILPKIVQHVMTLLLDVSQWDLFTSHIKHNIVIYNIREAKQSFLNRIWVVYYRNKTKYYYELNVNRQFDTEISNFFYKSRLNNNTRYNVILYYYFNKLSVLNYPYFYWNYIPVYFNYKFSAHPTNNSQHLRFYLFILFVNCVKTLNGLQRKVSFNKLAINTLKGYRFVFNIFRNASKINFITPITSQLEMMHTPQKFQRNNANHKNLLGLCRKVVEFVNNKTQEVGKIINSDAFGTVKNNTPITWYTKMHNTLLNLKSKSVVLFLRSSKHFNKGRYSRNRQIYRTGVYWCIWLNVVIVYGLHYFFYRVVFAFGYLWLPMCILILSIFSSRLYKYRFYSLQQLKIEFDEYNKFIFIWAHKLYITVKYKIEYYSAILERVIINYGYICYRSIDKRTRKFFNRVKKLLF